MRVTVDIQTPVKILPFLGECSGIALDSDFETYSNQSVLWFEHDLRHVYVGGEGSNAAAVCDAVKI